MSQPTSKNTGCVRLLIADDRPRARQSLEALFRAMRWSTPSRTERPIEIVGEADDDQQAVERVQALHPDVVVMDLPTHDSAKRVSLPVYPMSLPVPKLDGLAAIRTIKSRWPAVRVVMLTMYATDRAAALLAGADAFLLKGCPTSELLEAVMPRAC